MKRRSVVSFCVAVVSSTAVPVWPEVRPVIRSQVSNRISRVALERALPGAARKLADPECGRVLSDFSDASGRRLQENLGALQQTAPGYLELIVFADGHLRSACAKSKTLAVTHPGSRVVYLCPRFAQTSGQSEGYRENILIHEMLHSLGLEENPPSSNEITLRVQERCGP
jgi:hypothetical protein